MYNFLEYAVVLLGAIVLLGFFNEKVTKITNEIALLLFSAIVGIGILITLMIVEDSSAKQLLESAQLFNLEKFLMKGVLCFMLFAGSCHMKLRDFKENAKQITVLAILVTLLGAVFYGGLFYVVTKIVGLSFSLAECLMFGSIIAPTDPIAATSILKQFNLPKRISFFMEGESLFNDGVGVALFVCFSGMVTAQESGGFVKIMLQELLGAFAIGIVVALLFFKIFETTKDDIRKISTSLLAVILVYLLSDRLGCSGAIASVVCGICFSAFRNYRESQGKKLELETFDTFWEILDTMLNSILYAMMGMTFVRILHMPNVIFWSLVVIILNFCARFLSVLVGTLFMGKLPDHYDKGSFATLLTWGGLRGGLSIALAMSAAHMLDSDVYNIILGGTYAIVFFTTIVQGLTMKRIYFKIEKKVKQNAD